MTLRSMLCIALLSGLLGGCSHLADPPASVDSGLPLARMLGDVQPDTLNRFIAFYHPAATFSDPDVRLTDRSQLQAHFAALLHEVQVTQTQVLQQVRQGNRLMVWWQSDIRFLARPDQTVRYQLVSLLELDSQGLITARQDLFDSMAPWRQDPAMQRRLPQLWQQYFSTHEKGSR